MNKQYYDHFKADGYYHVYARSNNGEPLFLSDENRRFFLLKFDKYISPIATTCAYCLMDNHIHFLIRINSFQELAKELVITNDDVNGAVSETFRQFFISYSTSFNRYNDRKGNLFQRPFRRILVDNDDYFTALIGYIHCNPTKHLQQDHRNWKWSSYQSMLSSKPTKIARKEVLDWFGGVDEFIDFHKGYRDVLLDQAYWLE